MPKPKLTYFNVRGSAELARLLFALADVEYEDIRIENEQWAELKKDTPFGQLPILESDGVVFCQSRTIARYLANKFGFAGSTAVEKARADMVVDCLEDISQASAKAFFVEDKTAQKESIKKFTEDQLPGYMEKMEKILTFHKNGDTFFVMDEITWADLAIFNMIDWLQAIGVAIPFSKCSKIEGLIKRVENHPKVAEWLKKRPVTKM